MSEEWLAQWSTLALVALLVTAVLYAGRLVQRVVALEQGQTDVKAGHAALTTRMETLFADLHGDLRDLRCDVATYASAWPSLKRGKWRHLEPYGLSTANAPHTERDCAAGTVWRNSAINDLRRTAADVDRRQHLLRHINGMG